jgi:hypothetical protein
MPVSPYVVGEGFTFGESVPDPAGKTLDSGAPFRRYPNFLVSYAVVGLHLSLVG